MRAGAGWLALALALAPRAASACASCVASAYGDRSFNWGYFGLLLMPFLIAAVVGGLLAWNAGYRLPRLSTRALPGRSSPTSTETT